VLHNSGFGTVYGIVDGKAAARLRLWPGFCAIWFSDIVRCPAEQFTIQGFRRFLEEGVERQNRVREAQHRQFRNLFPLDRRRSLETTFGFTHAGVSGAYREGPSQSSDAKDVSRGSKCAA